MPAEARTSLVPDPEQRELVATARAFLRAEAPVAALRRLRDARDPLGFSRELWQRMAALGWAGAALPAQYGGAASGFVSLALLLEECGRTLTASPLFASCVLGAGAIELAGSAAQKEALLPRVADGSLTLALALEESHRHAPFACALSATRTANGYRLDGSKQFVLDGHSAQQLVVVARSAGTSGDQHGLTLLLVEADRPGITRHRLALMDSRNAARIELAGVAVARSALLGEDGEAASVLEQVLDRGRAALAAEMLGGMQECFERTIEFLKQREQFGAPIGSFQALQHRAAQLFAELELTRSAVRAACAAVDAADPALPLLASLAKSRASDGYEQITSEAVQMHGGIGTTDELDIGLFLKRARVCMQALGDAAFHRNRYARLRGF